MSVVAKQEAQVQSRAARWINEKFGEQLQLLADDLRESQRLTSDPEWQRMYRDNREDFHNAQRGAAKLIEIELDIVKHGETSEQCEKNIRDRVKELTAARESYEAYSRRAVAPHENRVHNLNEIRNSIRRDAEEYERESPLTHRGFGAEVREEMQKYPTALWDAEIGTVKLG